jgi:hypothetical protein
LEQDGIVDAGHTVLADTTADDRRAELARKATEVREGGAGLQHDDQLTGGIRRFGTSNTVVVAPARRVTASSDDWTNAGGARLGILSERGGWEDGRECETDDGDGDQTTNQRWNLPAIGVLP